MSAIFDTLDYTSGAIEAGFTRHQAEYQARQISKLLDGNGDNLAKKSDLKELELRLTIKLGSIMLAGMGILGFILKH